MIIKTIVFKRTKESEQEIGVEVEGSVILDRDSKVVPAPIWNAKDLSYILIDLSPTLEAISKIKFNI